MKHSLSSKWKPVACLSIFSVLLILIYGYKFYRDCVYYYPQISNTSELRNEAALILPDNFIIQEKLFGLTASLNIVSSSGNLIGVIKRLWTLDENYALYDTTNHILAASRRSIFTIGLKAYIVDDNNLPIGFIEEVVTLKILNFEGEYNIYDREKRLLMVVKRTELLKLKYEFFNVEGQLLAVLERNLYQLNFGHLYTATILRRDGFDGRFLLMLAAIRTGVERSKLRKSNGKKS